MKRVNSIVAIIIVIVILLTRMVPVQSVEPNPQIVHISSIDDLFLLSENCSFDRWSQGITVVLDGDIDLKGEAFTPIPIFGGIFDGNGYTIRGLSITVEGSNQGLFRYLQDDGIIKNLNVEGVVTPSGEKSTVGGMVGYNKGIIENCNFSGLVKGKDIVGGLVGWNGTSGMLVNSSFEGVIYGESKVGGIAGYNAGAILRCFNDSNVNTTVEEHKLDYKNLTLEDINLTKLISDAIDIGGIAGVNTGIVQNSENRGIVGYPHVGYNVGGVVGRQSGYITNSVNHGTIYGRKDVGGIVGQMEPHVNMLIPSSKLELLQGELNKLQSSITKLINDSRVSSDMVTQNLNHIQNDINNSKTHTQSLIDQTELLINKDIEEINKISITAIESIDQLIPIIDSLQGIADVMEKAVNPIKRSMHFMSEAMGDLSQFTEGYKELSDSMAYSIGEINQAINKIEKSISDLRNALNILQSGETEGVLELLESAWDNLKDAMQKIKDSINSLKNVEKDISAMIMTIGDLSRNMENALDYMLDAIGIMEDAQDYIVDIFEGVNNLLLYLAKQPELKFQTTDDFYQKTKEDLFESIDNISASFSEFVNTMSTQGNIMMDDIQNVSDQLFLVLNLMFNIVEEISSGDIDTEKIVKDVSRENIEKNTEGKVSECINHGSIEADINVGGIVGSMSIELKLDPEEDFNIGGRASLKTVFQTRAVISSCENKGSVISKKNNVGGIVGNMDLGYIKSCIAAGSVESTDGNYVGGIAGKSHGPIDSSFAKCALEGENNVGGIAGFGTEITNCYTLVKIHRGRACVGAIAGDIDKNSNIVSNYFVSDILSGIDGISYMEKAEPITYEVMITKKDIPLIFKEFKLSFWADNQLVDTIYFNYGDSISRRDFPKIPFKEGYYSRWKEFDNTNLTFDAKIQAEYIPYLTMLESNEKRDGTLSIVLIGGTFTEKDSLTLIQDDQFWSLPSKKAKLLEQWSVTIPEDGEDIHTIRYLPPTVKKNLEIYIVTDEKWTKTKVTWDGKYLVFHASGNVVVFSLVDVGFSYENYLALLAVVPLIIVILIVIIRRKGKITMNTNSTC